MKAMKWLDLSGIPTLCALYHLAPLPYVTVIIEQSVDPSVGKLPSNDPLDKVDISL